MGAMKKTIAREGCRNPRDKREELALIPLVMLVIVSVSGILLIAPSATSRIGLVLARTSRERGITCPPHYGGCENNGGDNKMTVYSADQPDVSSPSEPAEAEVATQKPATPEKTSATPIPAALPAVRPRKSPGTRTETLANAVPAARP